VTSALNAFGEIHHLVRTFDMLVAHPKIVLHVGTFFFAENVLNLEAQNVRTKQSQSVSLHFCDDFEKGIGFLLNVDFRLIVKRARIDISVR